MQKTKNVVTVERESYTSKEVKIAFVLVSKNIKRIDYKK